MATWEFHFSLRVAASVDIRTKEQDSVDPNQDEKPIDANLSSHLEFDGGGVMNISMFPADIAQRATRVAVAGFGVVATFQLALTLGAPWGKAALGGVNEGTLPPELRVVSAISMTMFVGAAFVVLGRAGHWGDRFSRAFRVGTWALVAYLGLGVLMNLASSSPWERFGWAPFSLLLAAATFVVAGGRSRTKRHERDD